MSHRFPRKQGNRQSKQEAPSIHAIPQLRLGLSGIGQPYFLPLSIVTVFVKDTKVERGGDNVVWHIDHLSNSQINSNGAEYIGLFFC